MQLSIYFVIFTPIEAQNFKDIFRNWMKGRGVNTFTLPKSFFNARYHAPINARHLFCEGPEHHSHNLTIGMKRGVEQGATYCGSTYELCKIYRAPRSCLTRLYDADVHVKHTFWRGLWTELFSYLGRRNCIELQMRIANYLINQT